MSKELAQAASSWRTQVGIALVLLIAAFGAVFALNRSAEAVFLQSPTISSNPNGGSQPIGTAVTFTAVVSHDGADMASTPITMSIPAGYDFIANGTCTETGGGSLGTGSATFAGGSPSNTSGPATVTCNVVISGGTGAAGAVTMTATAKLAAEGTVAGASLTAPFAVGPTPSFTVTNPVTVSPATATNANGMNHTVVWTLPAGWTCQSDATPADGTRSCAAGDVVLNGGAVLVSGPVVADTTAANQSAVTVVISGPANSTVSTTLAVQDSTGFGWTAQLATKTYTAAELRHMSDITDGVIGRQEINSNVRGSRHTICAVAGNTGIDNDNDGIFNESVTEAAVDRDINGDGDKLDTFADVPAVGITIPLNALSQINVSNGGGYTSILDPDPTFTDAQIFIGDGVAMPTGNGGLTGATCFSWVSTEAGDQEISVLYTGNDGNPYTVSWDSDNDANDNDGVLADGPTNKSIVKEWNVLEDSTVTLSGGYNGSLTYDYPTIYAVNVPGYFNPATSSYLIDAITISDVFNGSHINRTGGLEEPTLAGVLWNYDWEGCGSLTGATEGTTYVTYLNTDGQVVGGPSLTFDDGTGAQACTRTNGAVITITGWEPGPLGSGDGNVVIQEIHINIIEPIIPTKHVFLAWAGQRVMLEHDWRILPGDVDGNADGDTTDDDPDPLGVCPFGGSQSDDNYFLVQYIKGSGPGNFLPGPNVFLNGSDQANVTVENEEEQEDHEVPFEPWENCISRVLYESEDQGQVDIEAFVWGQTDDPDGLEPADGDDIDIPNDPIPAPTEDNFFPLADSQTKIAWVIYYMKLNTVQTSLVTSVEKPLHNATGSDYSPGNPWDASTDVTDADWNVSKDLLVRVRVSGWFLNSNPSGRERDASDPTNVLPADRWVMPNDWAALQGGACGFDCRPEYDYMFAPNNTKGIALTNPEGTAETLLTTVTVATTTTTVVVADASNIAVGASIKIGATTSTPVTVAAKSGNTLTVSAAATVAAGAKVYLVSGVPFEGPLSALDIPGRGPGMGSAALSDWDPNNVRDTRLGDQVLDWWDAPMPPANVVIDIRGAGFIKQVLKQDVYYLGTANATGQAYPNPYYIVDIPESPFLPAVVAGGGYAWDTWGLDGPGGSGDRVYRFWTPVRVGVNLNGVAGETLTTAQKTELAAIASAYGDNTIARRLVVFSDNHGEAMVTANGDFNLTYDDCVTNVLAGGKHCSQGDVVGKSTISALADYPDFRGKHFPVVSNTANVNWTWGGYKEVTVEPGEAEQFKYVVFHALDRDGFCATPTGVVSLHPVLSGHANDTFNGNPAETVDFLIDSDEGGIFIDGALKGVIEVTKEFATMKTFDTAANTTLKEFDPINGSASECQAWVKVSNSLLGRTNVLVIAHDDEGDIGFDKIVDFTDSVDYTLNFRWSLITWFGADGISPSDALSGTGANDGGSDIKSQVTAVYGWQQDSQEWLAYFPGGEDVPGANDLTGLNTGDAYWIAIKGPASITWTVVTDVN